MSKEPKWLPAQLTFGPAFMLLGLLHARVGPGMGWYDWVNILVAAAGTLQLSKGLITLLKTIRASANEVAFSASSSVLKAITSSHEAA